MKNDKDQERINANEEEIFSINFYINDKEGLVIKVNTNTKAVEFFKNVLGIDLTKLFKCKEFDNTIDRVWDLVEKEYIKNKES